MDKKKWLSYWKQGLLDSLKTDMDIEKSYHFEIENFEMGVQDIANIQAVEKLFDSEEIRVNKKNNILNKESERWIRLAEVQVAIAPIKIKLNKRNLSSWQNQPKFPFWFSAKLDREGHLQIPEEKFPHFQRKYLEPLADEKTEFIFTSMENVDNAFTMGKEKYELYVDYIHYVKNVFKSAVLQDIDTYKIEGYETVNNAIILVPDEEVGAALSIIQLYEKLLKGGRLPKLLETFITLANNKQKLPIDVPEMIDVNPLHLGQMGFDFPLSTSQRKSLYSFLAANDRVFAVNGPPGTGKTTLLQSIVANKFVESAIAGIDAPIILACSANNQAVTNIIESFSKSNTKEGHLQGRWLPEIEGYATYLPANSKTTDELKDINYKKLNSSDEGLFSRIENSNYLHKAKAFFIEKSAIYFGTNILNIDGIIKTLQQEIIQIKSILMNASKKWKEYLKIEKLFLSDYLLDNSKRGAYYDNGMLHVEVFRCDISNLKVVEDKIIRYFNNEYLFQKIFCFIGFKFAIRNRASEIKIILRDSLIEVSNYTKSSILESIDSKITMAKTIIKTIENWNSWKKQNKIAGNPPQTAEEYWNFELSKIKNKLAPNCFYDELDVALRHKAFQLTLHYWEGRYLAKLESDLLDKDFFKGQGENATKNRWIRQAMLTPCFVSTFYMSPKFFSAYKFLRKGENEKNIYDNPPLLNFIDLLIVDEAGQVTPEIGVATFSLAKQAVVVGDIKQIEPVWNTTSKIDIGNLKKCQLIKYYDDCIYETAFDPKGFLSSTGSIMKMAQNSCNFKDDNIGEKGVLLVEHRRCYDEIIDYCNVLAYNGQLVPLRGKAKSNLLFPPMYCIHVEGNSTLSNSSRYNQNEVDAITTWLSDNKPAIENKYGKIESAVGIITPFVEQKNRLKYALEKKGIDVKTLKLGTVHALQGAERQIVLFSMVYGKGDSGTMFFDRDNKPNMLNVAVSRAKDNFIVFANIAIFDKEANTPSGILSRHLKYKKERG
jgi:GTPase SAR1 family protein